ncbi:MAG TPA: 2-oxoacid:acceptor oxidoreductase family protein, partial [Tenuifilaceae bacterium]|nr:2-oxoacid:acceptor oxidoreductase family protein [Tenuifilaceae bacterium]
QSAKTFNMIVLGAFLKVKPVVKMENVIRGLEKSLPERHHHLIPLNKQAIDRGMEIVKEA